MKKIIITIIWLCCWILTGNQAQAQLAGCTDPQASNFDGNAAINNGSCLYNNTSYSPVSVASLDRKLREISGMIYFNGKLLALNDGGNGNLLYFLDTANGAILQTITVEGATNIDWEDMAQDSSFVYVGDFGNNATGNRQNLCIYKIDKATFAANPTEDFTIPATAVGKINFSYPDQTDFTAQANNTTYYDCEALAVRRGKLHLFSKNWTGGPSIHYQLPVDTGSFIAERLDSLQTNGMLITGAAIGGDDELILTGYNTGSLQCGLFLIYGFDSTNLFFDSGNKRAIRLPGFLTTGQLESICFVNATHGFMANEYFNQLIITVTNRLRKFSALQWIDSYYQHNPKWVAEAGMLRYNTDSSIYEVYDGYRWQTLSH